MTIIKKGNTSYSAITDVDENSIYTGSDNDLLYNRTYTKRFRCDFKLALYPFDTQYCKLVMSIDKTFISFHKKDLEMSGPVELMQYTVKNWIIEETSTGVVVTLVLGRKILNEILTTYLPTFLLIIIIHSTNYYKDFFFEAIVTVNLTGMLVLCTMFVSVSSNLPVTSDIKMIEVWLIFSLLVPFTEVLLHVYMDSLREEDRGINHHGKPRKVDGDDEKDDDL